MAFEGDNVSVSLQLGVRHGEDWTSTDVWMKVKTD
jgi:hypothetical protein